MPNSRRWANGSSPRFASTIAWRKNGADRHDDHRRPTAANGLIAWIDEVGGFLICLGEEVVIGQPTARQRIEIPIRADLSRRHATIRREGENYILTPIHTAKVDGQAVVGPDAASRQRVHRTGRIVAAPFHQAPHTECDRRAQDGIQAQDRTRGRCHRSDERKLRVRPQSPTATCGVPGGRATWCCFAAVKNCNFAPKKWSKSTNILATQAAQSPPIVAWPEKSLP